MTHRYRYPLEPLARAAEATDLHHLARALGISHRHARRMQAQGLAEREADHYAIHLGYHPSQIWPTWWHHIPTDQASAS